MGLAWGSPHKVLSRGELPTQSPRKVFPVGTVWGGFAWVSEAVFSQIIGLSEISCDFSCLVLKDSIVVSGPHLESRGYVIPEFCVCRACVKEMLFIFNES